MSSNESKIPVGQILVGKYRVVREIGRGGMAAVYEAEQLSLGKKVAVKVLASELAASTIVIERFFREARAAASVKSPYIVDVYDSGRLDDGRPFIAMELLEGESLYDRMARVRIIDVETTIRVIVHTAKGLMKAHAAGIVHRDLKPENIFLTKGEDGEELCKILDFGLAKFYAPVNEDKAQKRLTREGAVFGTPAYMSPEQVKGQGNVDHRADLWALGCMAFECLIGRPVWNMDQGVAMTFAAIATGPIPVPSQIRTDLPKELDVWFKKCLERDPARRYQSAKELADAFVASWGKSRGSNQSYPTFGSVSAAGASPAAGGAAQELALDLPSDDLVVPPPTTSRRGQLPSPRTNGARGSMASDASAIPLVQRASADVPPASQPTLPPQPTSPVRLAVSAVFLAASVSMAIFVWIRFVSPQVFVPTVQSTASAPPSAAPSSSAAPLEEPKWAALLAEGQAAFSKDSALAAKKFQDVVAMGGQGAVVGRVFAEQLKIATNAKDATGPCKVASFARPRTSWERRGERPAVLGTAKGTVVAWVDDHEQAGKDHVYAMLLDGTGKAIGTLKDLTPEAADAQRPQLMSHSTDRSVLVWWDKDKSGREAGVHARFLDAYGRIDPVKGRSVLVGAARSGDFWPVIEKGREGYIVAWQDDRAKEKEFDVFVRRLTSELDTAGPETRITDYHATKKGQAARIRYPAIAVAPSTLLVAYRLDKEKGDKEIVRLRVMLDELERSEKTAGLPENKDASRDSRVLGNDVVRISDDKSPGDAPAIACAKEGCFAVWHGEPSGAWAAYIDPNVGKVQWKRKLADKGARPSLAVNADGQVAVAYYENNRIKLAYLSRDGVSAWSSLLRIHDMNAPRPSLSAGTEKNEWALAWQDTDVPKGGVSEIYSSRVVCR